ncbi:unnamed protein product [Rotaria sp. Silwood1]|nr:unnamed protein product [Rotaria sp. Silwood1]
MMTTDSLNIPITNHVATLLDDLIIWRTIGNKQTGNTRDTANIQQHGGAWMPADRSFDRILFWRTIENNSFQLFEYSMSHNLLHNALQIQFGMPTTVLPNVFIVELPDRQEICLMFATHIGIYRWILKHPTISNSEQLEQSQSILADITDDYLNNRNHFYRHDLQSYTQVTCAYTNDHLIYALFNEMETIILRFDNQDYLNSPQQLTFPKRQSTGLFNFLWNPNKSLSSNQQNQPLIAGQTTIIYSTMTMTIILYDNSLLRFLSDQLDTILYEYNLSVDLPRLSSKVQTKMFLDYCQYETFSDELVTRLFVIIDSNDILHILIYEFQYDERNNFKYSLYQNKSYTKSIQSIDHSHLPHGSSLTSITCTNDRLILHLLTNQNRSILLLIQYELKTNNHEQFIELPMDYNEKYINDESTTIDDIERRLNSPGQFTIDMFKDALWITFNLNLDELNQSWISLTQILQQLPIILQSLIRLSRLRLEKIQEKVLPYLQDLSQIYQVLLWLSSCGIESTTMTVNDRDLFIENLVYQQPYKTRIGNQSLLEQILVDNIQQEQLTLDAENWFETIHKYVDNLFSLLWPSNDFLIKYLPSRHQWTILDQYCGKLDWFKELNSSRQFFHALAFYRSGTNIETATRHLAAVLKELHTDPLLIEMFGKQPIPELFYIEWVCFRMRKIQ